MAGGQPLRNIFEEKEAILSRSGQVAPVLLGTKTSEVPPGHRPGRCR
jgi:hypothetical protein